MSKPLINRSKIECRICDPFTHFVQMLSANAGVATDRTETARRSHSDSTINDVRKWNQKSKKTKQKYKVFHVGGCDVKLRMFLMTRSEARNKEGIDMWQLWMREELPNRQRVIQCIRDIEVMKYWNKQPKCFNTSSIQCWNVETSTRVFILSTLKEWKTSALFTFFNVERLKYWKTTRICSFVNGQAGYSGRAQLREHSDNPLKTQQSYAQLRGPKGRNWREWPGGPSVTTMAEDVKKTLPSFRVIQGSQIIWRLCLGWLFWPI